ncbi:DUF5719 family protein [Arthrobacter sp. B1805]|uniref:DUF5719 family protein n=1 Tax=Arthrobacter sp. B1805 TaxID=2058892 RepID=UPI0021572AFF|nr:DUF5719 family protein [Arthrobacter sp. B1805]
MIWGRKRDTTMRGVTAENADAQPAGDSAQGMQEESSAGITPADGSPVGGAPVSGTAAKPERADADIDATPAGAAVEPRVTESRTAGVADSEATADSAAEPEGADAAVVMPAGAAVESPVAESRTAGVADSEATADSAAELQRADAAVAARAVARDRAAGSGAGTRRRTRAGTAVGVATGVMLLAATAAIASGTVTETLIRTPGTGLAVPTAAVPAGDYTAVCPAPPRLLQAAVEGSDPEYSPASATAKTTVASLVLSDLSATLTGSGLLQADGGEPIRMIEEFSPEPNPAAEKPASSNEDGLTGRTAGVARGLSVDAPSVFRAQPQGGLTPVAAATSTYTATDGDLRGLAATGCQVPSSDFWLMGASTTVGQSSILILTNPTETPATVALELYGQDGPIEAAGTRGQLVAPGETRQIVLAGVSGNQDQVAVRVRSDGGRIAGFIQQSVLRGLTPGGVELLAPSGPAGVTQVLPGVVVQDEATARRIREQEGYGSAAPQLQVLVPGSSDAVLDIKVYGPDGEVALPGGGVVTAAAGSVTAVPLESLPGGNYTIAVTSDVSVVASARLTRGVDDGEPVDFAGAPAAVRLGSDHALAFAEGADVSLVLGAPSGRGEVTLTPVAADGALGKPVVIGIAGGTSVTVPSSSFGPTPAGVIVDATGDPVYGAQIATLPGARAGVSVVSVPAGATGPQSIPVELGY